MHAEDKMASDKLKEGIEGFSKALEDLEKMLAKRKASWRSGSSSSSDRPSVELPRAGATRYWQMLSSCFA